MRTDARPGKGAFSAEKSDALSEAVAKYTAQEAAIWRNQTVVFLFDEHHLLFNDAMRHCFFAGLEHAMAGLFAQRRYVWLFRKPVIGQL